MNDTSAWPDLPLAAWSETCDTLHLWTQIVGKVRMASTPLVNHWWNVTFHVTSRGLATLPIPYGARTFEIALHIWTMPSEIANAAPFEQDRTHAHYDPAYAQRFWRTLLQADRVMKVF